MSTNENTPISGQFWDWMQSYWHSNRDFPPAHPDWRKKADLVNGKVPAGQLPSYVDDVLEFSSYADLPQSGEKGKIYITNKDNKQFRWGGSAYIEINSGEKVGSKIINGSYNANDLSTNSITYGYSVANAPSTVGAHSFSILNLDTTNPDYKMQLGFDGDTNEMFSRIKSNGYWTDWSKYAASSQLGNVVTTNTSQEITGTKIFLSSGNGFYNNTLQVYSDGSVNASMSFYKEDFGVAQLSYDGDGFHTVDAYGSDHIPFTAKAFKKSNSDDSYLLLGGGGHKSLSEFMTMNTSQDVTGTKSYVNSSGNSSLYDNKLHVKGTNGSKAGISFWSDDVGQLTYFNTGFHFKNQFDTAYQFAKASAFIKNGSDNSYVLLGGGGHKPVSEFVAPYQLDAYVKKAIIIESDFNNISGNISGFFRANNYNGAGVKSIYSPMLHMGGYDTMSQLQIQYANGNEAVTGELSYRGGFNNYWGAWRTAWDNVNLNPVTLDTPQQITGKKTFETFFNTYADDGLFDSEAKPFSTLTPGGAKNILLGYKDYGSGQYYPRIGFKSNTNWSMGPIDNDFTIGKNNDGSSILKLKSSGEGYLSGGLTINSPDSIGSVNTGTLPQNYKLFLANSGGDIARYGTVFWTESNGMGYIQQQRADGQQNPYRLGLQPYGGELFYGSNEVATVNQFQNYLPLTGGTLSGVLNLQKLNSLALNGGQIINAGSANELYIGNPSVASVYLESGGNLLHYRSGFGVGVIWDEHNFNPGSKVSQAGADYYIGWDGSENYLFKDNVLQGYLLHSGNFNINNYYKKIEAVHAINTYEADTISSFNELNGKTQIGSINADGGWWHVMNIQHRNGVGDGVNYSGQLRFGMTANTNTMQFRQQYDGKWLPWKTIWNSDNFNPAQYVLQSSLNSQLANYFNKFAIDYIGASHDLNSLSQTGFYNVGHGTVGDATSYLNNTGAKALLHLQSEDPYTALQIQSHRYNGNLISRSKSDGVFSTWIRHWGDNDFTAADVSRWNNSISKSSASEEVILEDDTLKIQPDELSLEGSGSYDIASRKKLVHVLLREGKEVNIRELVRRQTMVVFNLSKDPVSLNIEGLKPYALSPGMQVTLYISDEREVLLYNETGFKKLQ